MFWDEQWFKELTGGIFTKKHQDEKHDIKVLRLISENVNKIQYIRTKFTDVEEIFENPYELTIVYFKFGGKRFKFTYNDYFVEGSHRKFRIKSLDGFIYTDDGERELKYFKNIWKNINHEYLERRADKTAAKDAKKQEELELAEKYINEMKSILIKQDY